MIYYHYIGVDTKSHYVCAYTSRATRGHWVRLTDGPDGKYEYPASRVKKNMMCGNDLENYGKDGVVEITEQQAKHLFRKYGVCWKYIKI